MYEHLLQSARANATRQVLESITEYIKKTNTLDKVGYLAKGNAKQTVLHQLLLDSGD